MDRYKGFLFWQPIKYYCLHMFVMYETLTILICHKAFYRPTKTNLVTSNMSSWGKMFKTQTRVKTFTNGNTEVSVGACWSSRVICYVNWSHYKFLCTYKQLLPELNLIGIVSFPQFSLCELKSLKMMYLQTTTYFLEVQLWFSHFMHIVHPAVPWKFIYL